MKHLQALQEIKKKTMKISSDNDRHLLMSMTARYIKNIQDIHCIKTNRIIPEEKVWILKPVYLGSLFSFKAYCTRE